MSLLTRLDGGKHIRLKDCDPSQHGGLDHVKAAERSLALRQELTELQELLYAAADNAVLIVLQGPDTAGKDGTIRHVMAGLNPQSCRVASFKAPTPLEAAHDFLWCVHIEAPAKGAVTIFNRSHYEDVLVVRVHKLVPEHIWTKRYDRIREFESLLADSGTIILKFFLNISKDEQAGRIRDREQDASKAWKLSVADLKERAYWDDYQAAYEDAVNRCAAPHAPWFVVPANHKWFRDVAIAEALVEALRPHKADWLRNLVARGKAELKEVKGLPGAV